MHYINTINFSLEKLSATKKPIGNFFVIFSQFGDVMQRMPIYSISNGVQTLVLSKLNEYSWLVLHAEIEGIRRDFSDKDYSFLREFKNSLKNLDPHFNIELKVKSQTITESVGEVPIEKS
ncbi:hypothetical protein U2F15_01325 [Acinetobacter baumannii]|uniref:hypothetical protein n=1 Tax=Acinetobacter baumannii TaxID=470 RepID=UPI002AF92A4C|nr:hypothetical protein [Acinetobacter baumannii]